MDPSIPLDLSAYEGSVDPEEVEFLRGHARAVRRGCIVEVGSWRGKSAIALATGAREVPEANRPLVYCIDPHRPFVGVYGGKFGPHDRAEFYQAMLRSGCADAVALVNLPSVDAARAFHEEVGLLFIDGDHSEAGVQADVDAWFPRLLPGATVLFDDAKDPEVGPYKVIERLTRDGQVTVTGSVGKIVAVQAAPRG
jgi:predicted O-methyltransferase YrrM